MRLIVALLLAVATVSPTAVHAHGFAVVTPDTLWSSWSVELSVLLPLILAVSLYAQGARRIWSRAGRARGIGYLHALAFALGAAALLVALVSPLDALGATLLSAHMAQHGLLVTAAPLLLLLGRPGVAFAWALPDRARRSLLRSSAWRSVARLGDALSQPLLAATLHGLALWLWHAPAAFDAAIASHAIHAFEHVSFFGTAILFWRAMLDARNERRAGSALGASFATLVHGGLLGALVTLAPFPLYTWYAGRTGPWGLSPLEDQQIAGLLMWVPMGIVYLGVCIALASRLVAAPVRPRGDTARARMRAQTS
jgi:putative membrane protein